MEKYDISKLRYTHRDYESVKADLLAAIPSLTQEWTSQEDTDPGVVLIKLMSMLGDNLSFNTDKIALEMYLPSVTQRKNCAKILRLLGYKMKWYQSARVVAHCRLKEAVDSQGNPVHVILRPFNTVFMAGNTQYVVINQGTGTGDIDVSSVTQSVSVNLVEGVSRQVTFTAADLVNNRYYFSEKNVDDSQLWLTYGARHTCVLVDDLYLSTSTTNAAFEFNVDEYDNPYIELVSYWKDIVGANVNTDSSSWFTLTYIVSSGSQGNISSDAFTSVSGAEGLRTVSTRAADGLEGVVLYDRSMNLIVTNLGNNRDETTSSDEEMLDDFNLPGRDPQTIEEAKADSANYVFTHNTLVTAVDFERAVRRVDGVTCSKLIDGEIIEINDLNAEDIVNRARDHFAYSEVSADFTFSSLDELTRVNTEGLGVSYRSLSEDDSAPTFTQNTFYEKTGDTYVLLVSEPEDWSTTYTQYYEISYDEDITAKVLRDSSHSDNLSYYILNPRNGQWIYKDNTHRSLAPYLALIYTGYGNFDVEYNDYYIDRGDNYSFGTSTSRKKSYSMTDDYYKKSGLSYYPYKPNPTFRTRLDETIKPIQIMNVQVDYGTTKVYPFQVAGDLYLIEPLSPFDTLSIVDLIDRNLEAYYYPSSQSYGSTPNFIDLVDRIQSSDQRIKYFDADSTMIVWSDTCTAAGSVKSQFDDTSFSMYLGLAEVPVGGTITSMEGFESAPVFIYNQEYPLYFSKDGDVYSPLEEEPSHWSSSYVNYYVRVGGSSFNLNERFRSFRLKNLSANTVVLHSLSELQGDPVEIRGFSFKTVKVDDIIQLRALASDMLENSSISYAQ